MNEIRSAEIPHNLCKAPWYHCQWRHYWSSLWWLLCPQSRAGHLTGSVQTFAVCFGLDNIIKNQQVIDGSYFNILACGLRTSSFDMSIYSIINSNMRIFDACSRLTERRRGLECSKWNGCLSLPYVPYRFVRDAIAKRVHVCHKTYLNECVNKA